MIFVIPLLFLFFGLLTMSDYGVNWDNSMHYNRGQAYLHYFLTGQTNYLNLPRNKHLDESVDFTDIRGELAPIYIEAPKSNQENNQPRSYYQSDVFNFEYFKEKDSGHPPVNGILASFTNYIFFQKLGILSDLYSYQIFGIMIAAALILGVTILVFYLYGIIPALIAGSSLALYPLFLSESHFNIKDPILASFFGLTIISLYFGVVKKNFLLIYLSAILSGLSLGTKFNTVFLPLIVGPWLIFYWVTIGKFKIRKEWILVFLISFIIPFAILYLLWPYLWFNGFSGILNILNYYLEEGTGSTADISGFNFFGFNFFTLIWIIITTPLPILALSSIGIVWLFNQLVRQKNHTSLLLILWLIIPVLRVTLPNTTIYGGVRHIMEYIPALSIASGIGAYFLIKKFSKLKNFLIILIAFLMLLVAAEMISIHPNQNIYFNQLVGGLSGAKKMNIPYAGNTFGNVYQQGIKWLNQNAEKNSQLGLPIGGTVNLPRENLRPDILLRNDNFSAFSKKGEYEIEMTYDWLPKNTFTYAYLENFLNPVKEIKVDGISLLKIWKNDLNHTKPGFEKEKKYSIKSVNIKGSELIINIGQKISLTRIYIIHGKNNCVNSINGSISTSLDGMEWKTEIDSISYPQMSANQISAEDKDFFYLFAAKPAAFISITPTGKSPCLLKNTQIEIWGLEKTPN